MDPASVQLITESTRRVVEGTDPAGLPAALADLGWFELWSKEPAVAGRALFGLQGALGRASGMICQLLGQELSPSTGVGRIALLPEITRTDLSAARSHDKVVEIRGLAPRPALIGATEVVFYSSSDRSIGTVDPTRLSWSPADGWDPDLQLAWVHGAVEESEIAFLSHDEEASAAADAALSLGRRLCAEEIIGAVGTQLAITIEHAKSRNQFGRPIRSFQAVQHRLADVHVAATAAIVALDESWVAEGGHASTMAKIASGTAARTAARHCQQVLGGMGFTWEFPFHRLARRTMLLDALLGSTLALRRLIGFDLLQSGVLPPAPSLEEM